MRNMQRISPISGRRNLWPKAAWVVLSVALILAAARMSQADNYALIVGIDQYQQSQRINTLQGATNDAKALANTLETVAGFPASNVTLLVSGSDPEPTGSNISGAVDAISKKIKAGDTLFVLYSGHGIDMDGTSYLVPWDADARTAASLTRTALPTSELRDTLAKVPAKILLMAFDMCRSDPRKGSRDLSSNNLLGPNQARDLHIVPKKDSKSAGPTNVITLFACREGERSWEWEDKQRGFFSYFLQQGLTHDAADSSGVVKSGTLVAYLQKSVYGAVSRDEGESQTPFALLDGKDPNDVVLVTKAEAGSSGAVTTLPASQSGPFDESMQQGFELYQQKQYQQAQAKFETALSQQPDSAKAANGLGRAYRDAKGNMKAEKYLRQAVQLDPKNSNFATDLADNLSARHDSVEAIPLYRTAMELDPGNTAPVLKYADICRQTKDNGTAKRLLIRATLINPKDPHPWDSLREIYYANRDYSSAEANYRKAVKLDTFGGQYLGHLVRCLMKEGKKADAQKIMDQSGDLGIKIPSELLNGLDIKSHLPHIGIFGL